MSLISCPECSNQVSSMAAACPNCAYPIANPASRVSDDRQLDGHRVVTIEQTSKTFKGIQAAGIACICASFVACSAGAGAHGSVTLLILGLMWLVGGRIAAWWFNG